MRDVFGFAVANGCFLAAGIGVTAAAGWWTGLRSLGTAYLAGVGGYGVVAQLLLVTGVAMARWQVVAVCLALASGFLVRRSGPIAPPLSVPRFAAAGVAAWLGLLLVDLWYQPLWAFDAWTLWAPKARALFELDGLEAAWFTAPELISRDYPLLLPAVEAATFRFTGYETTLLDVQSWLFVVAFVVVFVELVAPRARPWIAWSVLGTIVLAPSLANQLAAAEADVPLAVFFAGAGLFAHRWITDRSRAAVVLFGVFAAASAATKIEGAMFVVILAVVAAAVARSWLPAVLGVVALAVGVGPWRLWLALHDVPSQASARRLTDLDRVARVPEAAAYVATRLVDPRAWLLLVPLLAWVTVLTWRAGAGREAGFVAGVVGLCLLGLVVAYWTSPFELGYHLTTSARRVITAPVFFWAATAPLLPGIRRAP